MILHTLLHGYRAWKRREAMRRELMQLTDRELADIGICRPEMWSPKRSQSCDRRQPMRAALILLLLGSFATSALAAEAAEIHDPTFESGYAYAEPSYPPVNGSLVRLTRCWSRRKQDQSSVIR